MINAPILTPAYKNKDEPKLETPVKTTLVALNMPPLAFRNIFNPESIEVNLLLNFL